MAIIGIDLGTTNSLGSVYRNGDVELIPNAYDSFLTPSVVAVKPDGQVLVGLPAKKYQLEHPENAASLFKRKMGTKEEIKLGNRSFLPEELSSLIIRSIVADAERFLGEKVEEAVISVPAYFYDKQRYATKKAGALAGIKVERIINEPSAAALALYYLENTEQHILVFDFGGGTLDVTVVDCIGNVVGIESIAGDNMLGGSDFDRLIAKSFMDEHGLSNLGELEMEALLTVCEQCKIRLSKDKNTDISFVLDGKKYTSHYTLKRLAEESEEILKKIRNVVNHALRDADASIQDIEEVVMVGGSSKMPLIQSYMQFMFQKAPLVTVNCDEQIAIGLGAFCGIKARADGIKQYSLSDVCPFSLGTNTINEGNPENDYNFVIIPRNSMLPCSIERKLVTTHDNQKRLRIGIYQGEAMYAKDNIKLDEIKVSVPANMEGKEGANVRYTYDINGILIVDIKTTDGKHISRMISQNLEDDELKAHMKELEKLKIHPKDVEENQILLKKLAKAAEENTGYAHEWVMHAAEYFEKLLDEQNVWKIDKMRAQIESDLSEYINSSELGSDTVDIFLENYEREKDAAADDAEMTDTPEEWEVFKKWIN